MVDWRDGAAGTVSGKFPIMHFDANWPFVAYCKNVNISVSVLLSVFCDDAGSSDTLTSRQQDW